MKQILLIDNYDSFTYNLLHYLGELNAEVTVIRNDAKSAAEIAEMALDGIVISPGPGTPDNAGVCRDVVRELGATTPIFGVCLGHQTIADVFGGNIIRHTPMHGKTSPVLHNGKGVFAGLASPFTATRYHSLIVERETFPDSLEITAETEDGIIMGLQHKTQPIHGVQFHPESIASEHGHDILKNFLDLL